MKEIKAYVKIKAIENVVWELKNAGLNCMTIIDVSGLGDLLIDPEHCKYSWEFVSKMSKVVRIELVCKDEDVENAVNIIRQCGCTYEAGDGIIFVLPVERAVKVRTGEEGDQILQV